jgi:hypothetical protein
VDAHVARGIVAGVVLIALGIGSLVLAAQGKKTRLIPLLLP